MRPHEPSDAAKFIQRDPRYSRLGFPASRLRGPGFTVSPAAHRAHSRKECCCRSRVIYIGLQPYMSVKRQSRRDRQDNVPSRPKDAGDSGGMISDARLPAEGEAVGTSWKSRPGTFVHTAGLFCRFSGDHRDIQGWSTCSIKCVANKHRGVSIHRRKYTIRIRLTATGGEMSVVR